MVSQLALLAAPGKSTLGHLPPATKQVLKANLELPSAAASAGGGVCGHAGTDVHACAAALERFVERRPLLEGEALFSQGDPAEEFVVLESGQGEVDAWGLECCLSSVLFVIWKAYEIRFCVKKPALLRSLADVAPSIAV